MFVQGLVAGVVFAKLSRPNKRKRTIIFSNNAVITERDGKLCFLIKIGNIRISQLSDARIRLILIKSRLTKEGEYIPFQSYECKMGQEWSGRDTIFFPYPKIVEHVIDESSPFHEILRNNNKAVNENDDYEIVVILEGNIETTGASCHIRTSYLPDEVLWGYRFIPTYPYVTNNGYSFDFSKFNQVEPVNANLFHLNRNNNYSKIFSKFHKKSKNNAKSLPMPIFSFLKQANSTTTTSNVSTKKSLDSIFNPYNSLKLKSRINSTAKENSQNTTPQKNGRFTVVPVDNLDNECSTKIDLLKMKHQKAQTSNGSATTTTSTLVHFDEGYLTCKQTDVKNVRYFK